MTLFMMCLGQWNRFIAGFLWKLRIASSSLTAFDFSTKQTEPLCQCNPTRAIFVNRLWLQRFELIDRVAPLSFLAKWDVVTNRFDKAKCEARRI